MFYSGSHITHQVAELGFISKRFDHPLCGARGAARRGAVCAKITSNFGADISRCPTGFNFPSEITSLLNIVLYKYCPGGPAGTRHTSHLHFILYSAQSPWCRYWVLEFSSSRLKAISFQDISHRKF